MGRINNASVLSCMPLGHLKRAVDRFRTGQEAYRKSGMGGGKNAFCMCKKIRNGKGSTCLPGMLYLSEGKTDSGDYLLRKYKNMFVASIYPDPSCLKAIFRLVCTDNYPVEPIKKAARRADCLRRQAEL